LIGDKALLVGVVLIVCGPVLVHATMRSFLTRELGSWRAKLDRRETRREDGL
jgi:hypothetical protein